MHDFAPYGKHSVFIDYARPLDDLLRACCFDQVDIRVHLDRFPDVIAARGSQLKAVPSLALVDVQRLPENAQERERFCFENGYRYATTHELLAYRELMPMCLSGRLIIAMNARYDSGKTKQVLHMWRSSYSALGLTLIERMNRSANEALLLTAHGG